MTPRNLLAIVLSLLPLVASAQGTIYESRDKSGRVYSDVPSPGAKPIELPAPNVADSPKFPAQPPAPTAPEAAPTAYSQLAIVSPKNEDTIWSNTGDFDLQVQIRPALNASRGDTLRVSIDGRQLPRGYASTSIGIKAAEWLAGPTPDNLEHRLQVAVVDPSGAVLMESTPVRFFVRRHTATQRAR